MKIASSRFAPHSITPSRFAPSKFIGFVLKLLTAAIAAIKFWCDKSHGKAIPPHLLDSTFTTVTNAGKVTLVIDQTGENIGAAIASIGQKLSDPRFEKAAKMTGQAAGARRGNQWQGGDTEKSSKPQSGSSCSYTYEHGKYKDSAKHHPNSPKGVSKPPLDGQAALDRSFAVKGSTQRVTTENGKIVILKYEGNGSNVYHGYLVESFHSIQEGDVRKVLLDNKLVKNAKTGKIL